MMTTTTSLFAYAFEWVTLGMGGEILNVPHCRGERRETDGHRAQESTRLEDDKDASEN